MSNIRTLPTFSTTHWPCYRCGGYEYFNNRECARCRQLLSIENDRLREGARVPVVKSPGVPDTDPDPPSAA